MDDEQPQVPCYDSDRVVRATDFIDVRTFDGPGGEEKYDALIATVQKAMASTEEAYKADCIEDYERAMIAFTKAKVEHDEKTGSIMKILGALADEAYPDEILKMRPEKPEFIKWPVISADRIKMTVFPETNGRPKAVRFYVKYDS